MSGSFDNSLFSPEGGFAVRIRDLSGGNGAEPVETVRGFLTLAQANAFARRYVRDSIERCRAPGMTAEEVLAAWFAFGEDAEVVSKDGSAWNSGTEIRDFAAKKATDAEERNWRVLDPRRHEDDAEGGDEE
ncbi:hypothetical protein [Roseomonas marmotae]|uniref:Uncharacterized protein n=1 Tax=Roseomonas marmotae TaxID=2768161 RepID=A0ABS3KJG3_9PROT|nr:hypothetical protein [Roseomonas marmotae]MBO1076476.1 hypothetical protein [Roseomonas marmotae]QTI77924.1 hypothetical protein IAI58_09250 [Roseomonas marmotae]